VIFSERIDKDTAAVGVNALILSNYVFNIS